MSKLQTTEVVEKYLQDTHDTSKTASITGRDVPVPAEMCCTSSVCHACGSQVGAVVSRTCVGRRVEKCAAELTALLTSGIIAAARRALVERGDSKAAQNAGVAEGGGERGSI